ncbi:MAG: flagellar hook-associated protein FlgL [Burkholderiales bacterium]
MRLSTTDLFNQGVFNIQNRLAEVAQTSDRLSNGRRILTPSDDPVNAARSLEVEQSRSVIQQYSRNAGSANDSLAGADISLSSVTGLLQDIRTLGVAAGNGANSEQELKIYATQLRGFYNELMGLANTTDGNGLYLFSGYKGTTLPFTETSPGTVAYNGDQGQREIQIAPSRNVPISEDGSTIFQLIKTGNGSFLAQATGSNTGTGVISPGSVSDATKWNQASNSKTFQIVFDVNSAVTPPVTTYDIVDTVNNVSLLTGVAPAANGPYLRTYTDGSSIQLKTVAPPDTNAVPFDYGGEVSVKGAPADGDSFTIQPSTNQDIFKTVYDMIRALETGVKTPLGNTQLANRMNVALSNIDNGLNQVLKVRSATGTVMSEVDATKSANDDFVLQYDRQLSNLRDLDYSQAISDLARQQMTLQAAQKTFVQVQGLSLFNLL